MRAAPNRFFEAWAKAERRALVAWAVAAMQTVLACAALGLLYLERRKEPMVVRVSADGIPQTVALTEAYFEPNEAELRAFGANFATLFMRGDSYSLRQDWLWCAEHMLEELAERFKAEARGTATQPGALAVVEALGRRTEIPRDSLEIAVDKRPWPWRITVSGVRKVLGEDGEGRRWRLDLDVVRASRRVLPEGLIVTDCPVGRDGRDRPRPGGRLHGGEMSTVLPDRWKAMTTELVEQTARTIAETDRQGRNDSRKGWMLSGAGLVVVLLLAGLAADKREAQGKSSVTFGRGSVISTESTGTGSRLGDFSPPRMAPPPASAVQAAASPSPPAMDATRRTVAATPRRGTSPAARYEVLISEQDLRVALTESGSGAAQGRNTRRAPRRSRRVGVRLPC